MMVFTQSINRVESFERRGLIILKIVRFLEKTPLVEHPCSMGIHRRSLVFFS